MLWTVERRDLENGALLLQVSTQESGGLGKAVELPDPKTMSDAALTILAHAVLKWDQNPTLEGDQIRLDDRINECREHALALYAMLAEMRQEAADAGRDWEDPPGYDPNNPMSVLF